MPFVFSSRIFEVYHDFSGPAAADIFSRLFLMFFSFSFMASAVYILNDYTDRELDRQDPRKKNRPLASGAVSPLFAWVLMGGLIAAGLGAGYYLGLSVFAILLFYYIMNIFYTRLGKRIILVDVFIIAAGYILRVLAGAFAISVEASPWLLSTTFFIALFLGFFKRYYEVSTGEPEVLIGGQYDPETLKPITSITAALAIVTYSIYSITGPHADAYLIYSIPLVVMGVFRYYVLLQNPEKLEDGNPSDLLLADKFLILTILAWLALCAGLIIVFGSTV